MSQVENPNRIMGEIELLSTRFGNIQYDPYDLSSVLIMQFNLPPGFNRNYSRLLIDLGPEYPWLPPQDFYLDNGLRKRGKVPKHYYKNGFGSKKFCQDGFAWYSFHIKKWNPDPYSMVHGDSLLTAVNAFYQALRTD